MSEISSSHIAPPSSKSSLFSLDSDEDDATLFESAEILASELNEINNGKKGDESADLNETAGSAQTNSALTAFQKAKIERNRQKALLLRQARLQAHPYKNPDNSEQSVIRIANSRLIDTGGGFLIEQNELEQQESRTITVTQNPAPIVEPERPHCLECDLPLHDSFLYRSFLYPVCDTCRDDEEKHSLITRTDARDEFLLKDCDLDKREPILKFILRKNPHNPRWGDMKLYLRHQVEKRAIEVWGSEEALEEQRTQREEKREKAKVNKFNKQVKALRMAVRSSVYKKQTAGHQHEFGDEKYDEDEDIYFRVCGTCDYRQTYEKM